jgi:diguanylate cyclase (GGDEF)-like protein
MSETSEGIKTPPQIEKRNERRLGIDQRIQSTMDWLTTLQDQVDGGLITEDYRKELIARSMVAREILSNRANEKRRKDPMTGLLNNGAYKEEVQKLIDNGAPFGLLIIDIDHFKKVNDNYGHAVGDSVLIQTAQNLTSHIRQFREEREQNDQIFRYGGEELVVLFPGMHNEENLMMVAEKLRNAVNTSPYSVRKEEENIHIPITVSIGGGINRQQAERPFFEKVDTQGLYQAKETGRNKTVIVSG